MILLLVFLSGLAQAQIFPVEGLLGKASPIAQEQIEPLLNSVIRIGTRATGSAVIIGKTEHGQEIFLTARHNLPHTGQLFNLRYSVLGQVTDQVFQGSIFYSSPDMDFALGTVIGRGINSYSQLNFGSIQSGDVALLLGYPLLHLDPEDIVKSRFSRDQQSFSAGNILSEAEALEVVNKLTGNIKIDFRHEFMVRASAEVGMSGGAVVNMAGELVGIALAKTTMPVQGHYYAVALKLESVLKELKTAKYPSYQRKFFEPILKQKINSPSCRGFFGSP